MIDQNMRAASMIAIDRRLLELDTERASCLARITRLDALRAGVVEDQAIRVRILEVLEGGGRRPSELYRLAWPSCISKARRNAVTLEAERLIVMVGREPRSKSMRFELLNPPAAVQTEGLEPPKLAQRRDDDQYETVWSGGEGLSRSTGASSLAAFR